MSRRGYLDLTPMELLGRQYVVWGLGLFTLPPLLTSCHTAHYLCQAHGAGDVSPIVSLWVIFPWTLPIMLVMLAGLGMSFAGGALLLSGRHLSGLDRIETIAFRTCVGTVLAILFVGGFGYFLCDVVSPGFYYASATAVKSAWLASQALLTGVYLGTLALTFGAAWRAFSARPATT